MPLSFVLLPNKYFFNLHVLTLLLPFLSGYLGDTETIIRPFALKGHGSIAHLALPHVRLEVPSVVAVLCE